MVLSVVVDAFGGEFNENVANFNEFFAEEIDGAISRFGRFNPIFFQGLEGTGASLTYNFSEVVSLSAGYLAPEASEPGEGFGLFNGSFAALGQLSIFPTDDISLGLTFVHAFFPGDADEFAVSGETGSELANEPFGDVATSANLLGFQGMFDINRRLSLSAWAGITFAEAEADGEGVFAGDDATIINWAVTLAFPDLFREGNLGGLLVGQPPRVVFNSGGPDEADASVQVEAQYQHRINDNIRINPGFFVILNPENEADNDPIFVGTIRLIFNF
ncbi:MAG: carbohydrate porin [Cyanothece sp. SIO1E1]|nr:carbohydrate porin [Cyanothece sp. SIO1E1]